MSYVLKIWENPSGAVLPATVNEAVGLLEKLHKSRPGQNPKFILLAQRLTKRFPCPSSDDVPSDVEDISEDDDWAWGGASMDGKADAAVYVLGVNIRIEGLRPFVIQEANELGLCVMDDQAGEIYLPGGKFLSVHASPASQPVPEIDDDDVPKTRELAKHIFERLTSILAQKGYKAGKKNLSFKRELSNGWHQISVVTGKDWWPLRAEFEVTFRTRYHPVTDLANNLLGLASTPELMPDKDRATAVALQRDWMDDAAGGFIEGRAKRYVVHKNSEIGTVFKHLTMKLETRVLPLLHESETIEGLDALMNPEPPSKSIFTVIGGGEDQLITAYLARNTRLKPLCDEFYNLASRAGYGEDIKQCIQYFNSHPLEIS